jgi:acetyltransferase
MSLDERVAHERLLRICFNDYDREWTIVGEVDGSSGRKIVGVGRLTKVPGTAFARFTIIIIDEYHNKGLGTLLLKQLIQIAKQEHIEMIDSRIIKENVGMIKLCQTLGFEITPDKDPFVVRAQWRNN